MRTILFAVLAGALTTGDVVIALFFLKFWRRTRDRLFVMFSLAFAILAVQRILSVLTFEWSEADWKQYLLRLAAFVLIIVAIVDKNRSPDR